MTYTALRLACTMLLTSVTTYAAPAHTQTSTVRGVTMAVTPGTLQDPTPIWEFAVSLHSTRPRLDDDLVRSATLIAGPETLRPIAWEGQGPTRSHHRAGVLRFRSVEPVPDELELHVHRPGEAKPRVFRWSFAGWFAVSDPRRP